MASTRRSSWPRSSVRSKRRRRWPPKALQKGRRKAEAMAAPKTIPPRQPGLAGLNSSVPLVRAGMGTPEVAEIEAWTDEDYRRATGLLTVLAANGQADRQAVPAFEPPALRSAFGAML